MYTFASLPKQNPMKPSPGVSIKAHIKILLVLCYFVTVCIMFLAVHTISARVRDNFAVHVSVNRYLACEASSRDNGKSCDSEQRAYEDAAYPEVTMMSYIVSGALPAMTIIFVIQFEKLCVVLYDFWLIPIKYYETALRHI